VKKFLLLAVLALSAHGALAAKVPQPTATDQRIRQVVYNPSEVYEVTGSYRFTTTIEFEKGETVQYLTLGDTSAWQAHPMGHRVHLKPVEPRAVTNLTVVSDRRTYHFRLTGATPKDKLDATYLLRFSYSSDGDIAVNPAAVRRPTGASAKDDLASRVKVRNCNYAVSGSRNVKLVRACDDGLFTYLEFAENANVPAFFAVDPGGNESVVNYRMEGKYVVIERVGSLFTLRDGQEALCLFNEDKAFEKGNSLPRTSIKNRGSS
jgi:type IV secretion system protein VirB9